jgi:hypothetical protein
VKLSRLKPRIVVEPPAQESATAVETPAATPPADASPAPGTVPKFRIGLKPRTEGAAAAPAAPAETFPAVLDAPPPPGAAATSGEAPNFPPPPTGSEGEAADGSATQKFPAVSFPPPTAKFPPPAGAKKPAGVPEKKAADGSRKNLVPILGAVAVLVLGGAYFAFKKLTAEAPAQPRPAARQPAVNPPTDAPATVQQQLEKGKQDQMAPLNEVVGADQPAATPGSAATPAEGQPATDPAAANPPAVVAPPPPPPPPTASLPFKAWVQNLRIGGMRGGANPRVFIEHTAYAPGDVVNPNLGISFVGFNAETRMLIFKDKTGATVELRN